ncbi:DNA (cytosine-5-)-methyltransferase [Agrobacterium rubi]|nr:DNA (cytosine-5-)-methyltransferase [Agrobacterium rubi]NTF23868.1 DNA (cytosine-5-)-methyltransferase [Agrobacterium rubi]
MSLKAVDLFCGCGGLSTGLAAAGFEVAVGVDSWADALKVYEANHRSDTHDVVQHDLSDEASTIELARKYRPFLIAGGPPCQDFSSAGQRKEGDRADLTVKYANIVSSVLPTAFIMENVSRAQHADAFATAKDIFREAGYGLTQIVLNASLCGVPQLRKRLFLIGLQNAEDDFLLADLTSGQTEKPMTMRDYFGDELGLDHYYRHPRSYARRGIYSMDEPSSTIRGVNRPMPSTYKKHDNDTHVPDETVRALTIEERARIQTFPTGYFDTKLSKASKEQMIGNAVPVELGRYVGSKLYDHVRALGYGSDSVKTAKEAA